MLALFLCGASVSFAADNGLPPGYEADESLNRDLGLNKYGVPVHQFKNVFETETVEVPPIKLYFAEENSTDEPYSDDEAHPVPFIIYNCTTQTAEKTVVAENNRISGLRLKRGHAYMIYADKDFVDEGNHYIVANEDIPGGASRYYVWALKAGDQGVPSDGAYDYKTAYDGDNDANYLRKLNSIILHYNSSGFSDPRNVHVELPVKCGNESISGVEFSFVSDEYGSFSAMSQEDGIIRVDLAEDADYTITCNDKNYEFDSFLLTTKDKSEHKYIDETSHSKCAKGCYSYDHTCCQGVNELKLYRKGESYSDRTIWTSKAASLKTITGSDGKKKPVAEMTGMDFKTMLLLVRNMDDERQKILSGSGISVPSGSKAHCFDLTLVNPHRWEIAEVNGLSLHVTYRLPENLVAQKLYIIRKGSDKAEQVDFSQPSAGTIKFDVSNIPSGTLVAACTQKPAAASGSKSVSKKAVLKNGQAVTSSGSSYKVISASSGTAVLTKAKNIKNYTVPATIIAGGKKLKVTRINSGAFKGKKIRKVTISANVTKISANAFKGSKATRIVLKTRKLTKKSVKNSLKGSKVKTIQVKVGKKSLNKKYVKKYKKYFTKKNAGRKVKIK